MKAKLNLQAIRVAERLLKKPFGKFDLSDEDTIITLMYGMVSENNDEVFDLSRFRSLLSMKRMKAEIQGAIANELSYINQFNDGESVQGGDPPYMGDLASILIVSGLDPHFVLYEMKLFEVEDYIKAIDNKRRDEMEGQRLWTFLTILPHTDGKKIKKPQDLMMFPWEAEALEEKAIAKLDEDAEMFEKFINSKPL